MPRFALGKITGTRRALDALRTARESPTRLLRRHAHGDWGDLHPFDADANELALRQGMRVLSSFALDTGEMLWILTAADRSTTTLLLPQEY